MPGGVCAVLDYDVELMAEYVAEMAMRLTSDKTEGSVTFRKFISQILSSTRLPSTTILLGMNYLAKRINLQVGNQQVPVSDGQVWRMMTVALLLGSKFLDDNTFQNRSWAEVSGIPVQELNTLELEWMGIMEWRLYVNLDRSEDYKAWLKHWQDYSRSKKLHHQGSSGRERFTPHSPLSPLSPMSSPPSYDTEMARSRSDHTTYNAWHQNQVAEYERLSSMKRAEQVHQHAYRPRELSWTSYPAQPGQWNNNSPLTPPDSGYGTPDHVNSAAAVNGRYMDWFSHHANQGFASNSFGRQQQHHQQPGGHPNYQSRNHPGHPYGFFGHNIWEHSAGECNSLGCTPSVHHKPPPPYFGMHPGYGQAVMG